MTKSTVIKLKLANSDITKVRVSLMSCIREMLGDKTHEFNDQSGVCVTDEEECQRWNALKCNSNEVTLDDESNNRTYTLDLGDVGTDDLHTLVDTIYHELLEEKV